MASSVSTLDPLELERRRRDGEPVELVDVRTPAEFRSVHAAPARNVPLDQLRDETLRELAGRAAQRPVYLICQQGGRGESACRKICAAGGVHVVNVAGGTAAWEAAGLPVVRGKKAMSLDRQVRLGAGALVLVGIALAYAIHPAWIGLSIFIGAGLVFSGITGFCGMAILLAKMPWNQDSGGACAEKP
jgi:rhodanese-related sulfurtransferase